jgi:hypothetical protein
VQLNKKSVSIYSKHVKLDKSIVGNEKQSHKKNGFNDDRYLGKTILFKEVQFCINDESIDESFLN